VPDLKMSVVTTSAQQDGSRGARAPRAPVAIAAARRKRRRAQRKPRPAAGSSAGTGRAWINGREVGGGDPRFDHLAVSYD
jgi:hypothetical protein